MGSAEFLGFTLIHCCMQLIPQLDAHQSSERGSHRHCLWHQHTLEAEVEVLKHHDIMAAAG